MSNPFTKSEKTNRIQSMYLKSLLTLSLNQVFDATEFSEMFIGSQELSASVDYKDYTFSINLNSEGFFRMVICSFDNSVMDSYDIFDDNLNGFDRDELSSMTVTYVIDALMCLAGTHGLFRELAA